MFFMEPPGRQMTNLVDSLLTMPNACWLLGAVTIKLEIGQTNARDCLNCDPRVELCISGRIFVPVFRNA